MDALLVAARVLLAAVRAVAGIAKLADRAGSAQALIGFGVPTRFAAVFATILPLVELVVAVGLLPVAAAWWGALGALLLLFVAGISLNLARGRNPDCHCFGQLHSEPTGRSTLIRNGLLATVAAFVVFRLVHRHDAPEVTSVLVGVTVNDVQIDSHGLARQALAARRPI
jgi:uncharacterized membrane protein YphA (DoxX/SURF4 family)